MSDEQRAPTPPTEGGPASPRRPRGWVLVSVLVRGGLAALVLLAALAIVFVLVLSRPEIMPDDSTITPPIVEVVRAEARAVPRVWEGYGTARAMDAADVPAQVSARVVERPETAEAGEPIERGGLIVRLDETDFRERAAAAEQTVASLEADLAGLDIEERRLGEQVELAEGERELAQRDYERAQQADRRGVSSPGELDGKLAAVRSASRVVAGLRQQLDLIPSRRASTRARLAGERANLRVAEENLARTRVVSPIAGVLQSVGPEEGEWIAAGSSVARVVDLSRLEIPVRLPASASGTVGVGDRVDLRTDGDDGLAWSGQITRVAPEADADARTITAYVEVRQDPAAARALRPGRFVVGRVSGRAGEPLLIVPRRAVEDDRVFVAVEAGGGVEAGDPGASRVEARSVRVLHYAEGRFPGLDPEEDEWAVLSGGELEPGASVIVSNLEQLRAGMVIEARDRGEGARAGGGR